LADFPTLVYRCPGPNWGPPSTTYQSLGVADEAAFDKALADGWHASLIEAVEAFLNPAPARVAIVSEPIDNAPPTRDEMLAKAAEIGLAADKRWSDKTLANKIIEALEAQEVAETAAPAEPTPEPTPEPDPEAAS
jgi:hypothetical protein